MTRGKPCSLAPAAALLAVLGAGCGKKLPPLPPLQAIPARVEPLTVSQQATDAVLRFPYPTKTVAGAPLDGLTRVTLFRETVPAAPGAPPPPPAEGPAREREEKLFLSRAERLGDLGRAELDEATVGGELLVRDPLHALFAEKRLGRVFLRYAVTATRDRRSVSQLSPIVSLKPLVPPGAPQALSAVVEASRVCLEWKAPVEMLDGSLGVTVAAYAVYRRDDVPGSDPVYDEPVGLASRGPFFVDEAVSAGRRYVYTVRAAPAPGPPFVLGPPAEEVLADTRDVFPPPAPEGLLLLRETGGVRLVWSPVRSGDLDGYRVYRRAADGSLTPLAPRVAETTYFDAGAAPEAAYAVTAVDKAGNESPRAEAAPEARR